MAAARAPRRRRRVPAFARWLFWEHDAGRLDLEAHGNTVIARVLERGTMREVQWLLDELGAERLRRFFREVPHPEVTPRTRAFWRAYFRATEPWPEPPRWRNHSSMPWVV